MMHGTNLVDPKTVNDFTHVSALENVVNQWLNVVTGVAWFKHVL